MDLKKRLFRYGAIFLAGVAALVGVETGVLYYLNNVYLRENDNYKVTRLTSSSASSQARASVTLPTDAQDTCVSHEGGYIAYLENGTVHIVNMTTGQITNVPAQKNRTVAYFKWVYDHDRLILVEKNTGGSSNDSSAADDSTSDPFAEFYSFDMSDKTIQLVRDYMNNANVRISLYSENDSIADMDMSTETVVTYLKITSSSGRSRLWEANITVRNAALPDLPTHHIGKIQSLKSNDYLLYEDSDTGHVYLYSAAKENSKLLSINGQKDLKLLGFDQNDNQYFGIVQNKQVTSVVYGSPLTESWKTIVLPSPTAASDIYVSYSGTVCVNSESASTLTALSTAKESIAYTGKILGVYESGFYTLSNGVVTDHAFPTASSASSGASSGDISSDASASSPASSSAASSDAVSSESSSSLSTSSQ